MAEALESEPHITAASCIIGCDMSHVMSSMAVDIVSQSRHSGRIHIVNKRSTQLTCPTDLPAKFVCVVKFFFTRVMLC